MSFSNSDTSNTEKEDFMPDFVSPDEFLYEASREKYFEIGFFDELFEFVSNLDIKMYFVSILKYIYMVTKKLESEIETNSRKITRSPDVQIIRDISKIKRMSFKDFKSLVHTTPALIPIMILLIRIHIYLKLISNRNSFMNSVTISIDKIALLHELWGNNLCSGTCLKARAREVFPIIQKQWTRYPKIQKQYEILGFLYLCIDKAIYKPIEKMEDRMLMDIDTLLDTYFHTEDTEEEYCNGCGLPFIPNASDKLDSILKGNVKNPDKMKKEKETLESYLDSYHDYKNYKFWHKKLKFIIKNIDKCHYKVKNKTLDSNLTNQQMEDFEEMIDLIFCCNKNKKDCQNYDGSRCSKDWQKNLFDYIKTQDEDLYVVIVDKMHNKTFNKLKKYINSISEKEFAFSLVKEFYPLLKDKTNKTIQNRYANHEKDEGLLWRIRLYNDRIRNFNLDHKESEFKALEEKMLDEFSELYGYYEDYTYEPNEIYYKRIIKLIEKISKKLEKIPT